MTAGEADVRYAAAWLDQHWPRRELGIDWWNAVDPDELWMSSGCDCVCGQLGQVVAAYLGWEVTAGDDDLGDGWIRPAEYSNPISGYDLLAARSGRRVVSGEIRGARQLLGYDEMPERARCAFESEVPGVLWVAEIRLRRERTGRSRV
jgi:hypothetical protein